MTSLSFLCQTIQTSSVALATYLYTASATLLVCLRVWTASYHANNVTVESRCVTLTQSIFFVMFVLSGGDGCVTAAAIAIDTGG